MSEKHTFNIEIVQNGLVVEREATGYKAYYEDFTEWVSKVIIDKHLDTHKRIHHKDGFGKFKVIFQIVDGD